MKQFTLLIFAVALMFSRLSTHAAVPGPAITGSFSSIPAGTVVNLSMEGEIDWIHWGLFTESSVDRKAGVASQISNFSVLDASNGYAYVYQFGDNANGYSWFDGMPNGAVTNTTTGVWAYGVPQIGSGFSITTPADTSTRTLKVYVGSYAARGRFEAFLSDGSAAGYTNTSLFNMTSGPSGFYTLTYAAASSGQHLTVRWTLANAFRADGNVTLQAAALTSSQANNPPYVVVTQPPNNSGVAAGSTLTIEAAANDLDGTVATVEFYADETKLGEDTTSPYSFTWANIPAGLHVLTARAVDNQDGSSVSAPIEIFVAGSGGSLGAIRSEAPLSVNLTTAGTRDWTHWGLATNNWLNRKAGVTPQISDYIKIGTNAAQRYTDNRTAFSWSDGNPVMNMPGTNVGVYTTGVTNGFEITVPADTNSRTLKVYVGLYGAQGNFQAWLSDFSAGAYTDTTLSNFYGNSYAVYTITFSAASAGQSLTARYRSRQLFDQQFGNVTLQAATLMTESIVEGPPVVQITSPQNDAMFSAPASFTIIASASDVDGNVSQVEFFNGAESLGVDLSSPYSMGVNGLSSGTYTIAAVATDNVGLKGTNQIMITVTSAPPQAVVINGVAATGTNIQFSFATESGRMYSVQRTASLPSTNWTSITNVIGNGSDATVHDLRSLPAQFYRVGAE